VDQFRKRDLLKMHHIGIPLSPNFQNSIASSQPQQSTTPTTPTHSYGHAHNGNNGNNIPEASAAVQSQVATNLGKVAAAAREAQERKDRKDQRRAAATAAKQQQQQFATSSDGNEKESTGHTTIDASEGEKKRLATMYRLQHAMKRAFADEFNNNLHYGHDDDDINNKAINTQTSPSATSTPSLLSSPQSSSSLLSQSIAAKSSVPLLPTEPSLACSIPSKL
jgi:hypothetical protein